MSCAKLKLAEIIFVKAALPERICARCGATLSSVADLCTAELDEACPGFQGIENAKRRFWEGLRR